MIHWKDAAQKPQPAWAVIFSLERLEVREGYDEMDAETLAAVLHQPGYLGYESVYNGNRGIFISYWESKAAIDAWANDRLHREAKSQAFRWYKRYISAITEIKQWREYGL